MNTMLIMKIKFRSFMFILTSILTTRIFTVFGHLLEDGVLHKEAWVVKLLGTHLSIQVHIRSNFRRDNSSLAVKEVNINMKLLNFIFIISMVFILTNLSSCQFEEVSSEYWTCFTIKYVRY